jgi:tetrahydromethanopterin S-methyltransferase subunit G
MPEYRDEPTKFAEPSRAEIRARSGRNIAIAVGLVFFLVLIAVSIVLRQPA